MKRKIYFLLALTLAIDSVAMAAPEGEGAEKAMESGVLPPLAADMLVILGLVMGVISLMVAAYVWAGLRQTNEAVAKFSKLNSEVRSLRQKVETLERLMPDDLSSLGSAASSGPVPAVPDAKPMEKSIWQAFVDDFNKLAKSMDVPKALEACDRFVQTKKLFLLICLEPAAMDGNVPTPKFAEVDGVAMSAFWAWKSTENDGRFAVVPNPLHPYDKTSHDTGGLKETFASNFEDGVYSKVEVKLPAIFRREENRWLVEQPGLIRLER